MSNRYGRGAPPSARWRLALLVVLVAIGAVAVGGCGSSSSSSSTQAASSSGTTATGTSTTEKSHLATAKFVAHAGLAFGAFHRWIYKPFKAGNFTGGNLKAHKAAAVKAALAGLFAYHEIKLATEAAKASPTLSKLLAPLSALESKLKSLATGIKSGNVDPTAITSANGDARSLSSLASSAGAAISEKLPSASQLLTGG
jgi:hypothetical protein